MHKLSYRKFLASLLVSSLMAPLFPFAALAQVAGASSLAPSTRGGNTLDSLVQDTTGAIAAAAISCNATRIHSAISSLFSSSAEEVAANASDTDQQVHFGASDPTKTQIEAIANATDAETNKTTCTNAIEKAAAGVILRQLTISTVNWINHGLNGNPFYSTDTGSALKSVRDTAIKSLNTAIGFDSKNYPFGRSVAQSIAAQIGSSFEQQARYSLDAVINQQYPGMTNADFQRDFSIGGWDAFLAQTALNNNPFGFNMQARDVVASRIASTSYSPAQDLKDQLARSGGFFDQRVCADPNYDQNADVAGTNAADSAAADKAAATSAAESAAADALVAARASGDTVAIQAAQARLSALQALSAQANADLARADAASAAATAKSVCNKWVVQTPGSVISHALTSSLDIGSNQLINGQDLSTDITAVFNALTNQLINKGLSSLSTADATSADFKNNSNGTAANNQTSVTVTGGATGSWSSQGSNFNVFTDIPSVIRYEDNKGTDPTLSSGCTSAVGFNQKGQFCAGDPTLPEGYQQVLAKEVVAQENALSSIYELDYCIPGPHPGAIAAIDTNAQNFVGNPSLFPASADSSSFHKVLSKYGGTAGLVAGIAAGAAIGSVVPGLGTAIGAVVGAAIGLALTAIGNNKDHTNENAYGPFVSSILGVEVNYSGGGQADVNGHDNTANIVTTLAHRYKEAMQMTYSPTSADVAAAQAANDKDPNGTLLSVLPATTSSSTTSATSAPDVPDLSTPNAARLATVTAGYNALSGPSSDINDLVALNTTEYMKVAGYIQNVTKNQSLIDQSKSIESQLERLMTRINNLPLQDGYPGVNGPLDLVPIITLKGDRVMTLGVGDVFIDPGATAIDGHSANSAGDGVITSRIVRISNVNTAAPGIYTVTYDVTDSSGISANQVVRSVRVTDPVTGSVGTVVPNSAVSSQAVLGADLSIASLNDAIASSAPVRNYNKDLQAIQNIGNVSLLTPYEAELKRINNTFQQLAPYIHGVDDLKKAEAELDTMNNEASSIAFYPSGSSTSGMPKSGALKDCIDETAPGSLYQKDGGPLGRVAFSFITSGDGTVSSLPAWLLAKLPPQMSFLPDWHYAQGEGIRLHGKNWFPGDGEPDYPAGVQDVDFFFPGYHGNTMNPTAGGVVGKETSGPVTLDDAKLIRNDDVSTINVQPVLNAMKGLEHIVGMY